MKEMFDKKVQTHLVFEIENLERNLKFRINTYEEYDKSFIERLLKGKLKLKGKYCSEIFVYLNDDYNGNPNLAMSNDKKCEKLFIMRYMSSYHFCNIGQYKFDRTFLKELVCSDCQYKVKDVYFEIINNYDASLY